MVRERELISISGIAPALLILAIFIGGISYLVRQQPGPTVAIPIVIVLVLNGLAAKGLFVVNPNEGKVAQFFGGYAGTDRRPGPRWANPLYTRKAVSLRVRNFESGKLKVNDQDGNPIEIGAVVVWRVVDTAEAAFEVDDYQHYVHIQSEAALRNLATHHPYDATTPGQLSLRANTDEIAKQLQKEIQDRLAKAGVEVIEARISHLAYAPEIAATMLRRQQAGAVIAARTKIVEGAVGMVNMALEQLASRQIVQLDEDRKAAMVSNLLVILCGEHEARPVVNTGTIYQ
ncbi:MAG TPA: SPFH domain-containing protein [Tepidisphaeraceae bacterium]|nr:SPFH domain-containing protein [Tepidisphaeraceae bacterium]